MFHLLINLLYTSLLCSRKFRFSSKITPRTFVCGTSFILFSPNLNSFGIKSLFFSAVPKQMTSVLLGKQLMTIRHFLAHLFTASRTCCSLSRQLSVELHDILMVPSSANLYKTMSSSSILCKKQVIALRLATLI